MLPPDRPAIFREGWSKILPSGSEKISRGYSNLIENQVGRHVCAPKRYSMRARRSALTIFPELTKRIESTRIGATLQDQVGYFLSPFDFLKELFTFFLFNFAFRRLVLFPFFIPTSLKIRSLVVGLPAEALA